MSQYNESGYTESGFDEGDTGAAVNCDLIPVLNLLNSLVTKVDSLQASVNSLGNDVAENNTVLLAVNQKVTEIQTDALTVQNVIDNTLSVDDITTNIPMVDDQGLRVYPNGTEVDIIGVNGVGVVESSSFFPIGDHEYAVQYVISMDGRMSNFSSHYVTQHVVQG